MITITQTKLLAAVIALAASVSFASISTVTPAKDTAPFTVGVEQG